MNLALGRTLAIASNTFAEAIRDRVLYLIAFFALILVAAVALLPELTIPTTEDKILLDVGFAVMNLLSLLIAIFIGTNLVNKEIEKRTVLVLLAKPIARWEFLVGKHLGLSAVLAVLVFLMSLVYAGVFTLRGLPFPLASISLAAVFLFLQLALLAAVAIFFGSFTSSLLAAILTFGVYVMGNFTRDLLAAGEISENPALQRVTQGLYLVLPDLSRLDLKNDAVYGLAALPDPLNLVLNAVYGIAYIVLLLAIAIFIFARREF